jgi:glycosyltransferase involved in cell wall biosynthesis
MAFLVIWRLLKKADTCVTVSNSTAKALVKLGLQRNRIHVSGNGVDLEYIKSFKTEDTKASDGVFVGRVSREKGVFDLIKSWKQIVDNETNAQLRIIGSGPNMDNVKKMVSELGLNENIAVMGQLGDKEMYTLMKASKVFVFPSYFEGWGLAVAESLACGLPAICYDISAIHEVFSYCQNVFLTPIGDIEKLAKTTRYVIEKNRKKELADISLEFVKRFDWKEIAKKDWEIFQNLVSQSH